jgi:hypothetical protein
MLRNGTCSPARRGTMESRHSFKESTCQTREIADAIPKRIAARTRDRMHPDAARKTIRSVAAADLREALRVPRVRRAAVKGARVPSRSAVPGAAQRKVRAAPAPLRDAGLPPDVVLREAKTPSRRSLSPISSRASAGRPVLFPESRGAVASGSAARIRLGRKGKVSDSTRRAATARVRRAHSWVLRPREIYGCPYRSPHAGPGAGNAREEFAAPPRKDAPHR